MRTMAAMAAMAFSCFERNGDPQKMWPQILEFFESWKLVFLVASDG